MIEAALFDFDGVVCDTEHQYTEFWGSQCRRYYPEQPGLELRIKGSTLTEIYANYFASVKAEHAAITQRLNAFEEQMHFDYVPGFETFIHQLRAHGVKTAVVTSSNQAKMANVYRAHPDFHELFDAILTSEDFERSKPDPDCYLKGAQLLGVKIEKCAGFEDSINGLKAVKASGALVVGLTTTNPVEQVQPLSDIVIADFIELNVDALLRRRA